MYQVFKSSNAASGSRCRCMSVIWRGCGCGVLFFTPLHLLLHVVSKTNPTKANERPMQKHLFEKHTNSNQMPQEINVISILCDPSIFLKLVSKWASDFLSRCYTKDVKHLQDKWNKQTDDQAQTTFKPNWRLKACAFALDRKYRPRKQETSLNTQPFIIFLELWI